MISAISFDGKYSLGLTQINGFVRKAYTSYSNNIVTNSSLLNLDGDSSMNGKLSVSGDVSMNGNLNVLGIAYAPTASAVTNNTQIATTAFVKTAIDNLVGGAGPALDTLNELAIALGNDSNYATTISTKLGKVDSSINNVYSSYYNKTSIDSSINSGFYNKTSIDSSINSGFYNKTYINKN